MYKRQVELIAALEEEFDLEIEQDEVVGVLTLDSATEWIAGAVAKQNG